MRFCAVLTSFLILSMSGCMTERLQPVVEYPAVPEQTTFIVSKIEYDAHGRPLFREKLSQRPGRVGDQFAIVHAVNGKPVRSYDVAIIEQQKADMSKLFAVVYEWTGRGFEGGMVVSQGFLRNGSSLSGREAAAYLAISAAPVVIGGVAGFVVGLVVSVPETAAELKNVIVNAREAVTGSRVYEYDEKGRIKFMRLYPPLEREGELVKTEFRYIGDSEVPVETEVDSLVEKTVRIIR